MPPKVIGAGHGRTGTNSTREALAKLYNCPKAKVYHMDSILHEGQIADAKIWMDMLEAKGKGDKEKVKALAKPMLDPYECLLDYPPSIFYEELMELYPEAKCLITTREADAWYTSVVQTLYAVRQAQEGTWMIYVDSWMIKFTAMVDALLWKGPNCLLPNFIDDKAGTIKRFDEWTTTALSKFPKDRVLAFSVKEGWDPLCKFLGKPVPEGPYPRVNEAQVFADVIKILGRVDRIGKFVVAPVLCSLVGFGVMKAMKAMKA